MSTTFDIAFTFFSDFAHSIVSPFATEAAYYTRICIFSSLEQQTVEKQQMVCFEHLRNSFHIGKQQKVTKQQ